MNRRVLSLVALALAALLMAPATSFAQFRGFGHGAYGYQLFGGGNGAPYPNYGGGYFVSPSGYYAGDSYAAPAYGGSYDQPYTYAAPVYGGSYVQPYSYTAPVYNGGYSVVVPSVSGYSTYYAPIAGTVWRR